MEALRRPLKEYLEELHRIRASGLATNETSYYPALDGLFKAIGGGLTPPVGPIHQVRDQGEGHPDFAVQVEGSGDVRAAIEAKGPADDVEVVARSEQVRKYLRGYDLTLVTNLRDFALTRRGANGVPEIFMRHTLAASAESLWQTPVRELAAAHEQPLTDLLTTAMLWEARLTRPRDLAGALARYARAALHRLEEQPATALDPLREALSNALGLRFTDEQGEHFFRSSLVQTLFYGLFSAWVVWNRRGAPDGEQGFRWQTAGDSLSLPVLRELFESMAQGGKLQDLNIRQPLEWAVTTLRRAGWEDFAAAFDESDAVNYFYEPFLEAYDHELREQLGVWYTPREIIRYQVARVDRLLREELGKPLGLADPDVLALDPATGTGGYLLEVLRVIDATLRAQGEDATRALLLRRAATQRIFGFEILPAPFVVAHLQLATLLRGLGAPLGEGERAGVYLTNALTGWKQADPNQPIQQHFAGYPYLKKEVESAGVVKRSPKILVVLGNPPYNGFAGVAEDEEAELIKPYYERLQARFDVQPRAINDLYVRFFRLAERQIAETTGRGIVSFISNSNWLSGLSHPVMREHMLSAFDKLWIDNLNGDKYATGKRTPWGTSDQSIFTTEGDPRGIQVGTAITTMLRQANHVGELASVEYRDFWGLSSEKRTALLDSLSDGHAATPYTSLQPEERARYALRPGGGEESYLTWPTLPQVFARYFPGVKTSRDADLVSIDREPLEARMRQYFDASLKDAHMAEVAPMLMKDASGYNAAATRKELLRTSHFREDRIVRVAYRPLDDRWLYWEATTKLLDRNRADFFEQVFPGNLYLVANASSRRSGAHNTVADKFVCLDLMDRNALCFPLRIHHIAVGRVVDEPNLSDALQQQLPPEWLSDIDVLNQAVFFHTLAIFRSPLFYEDNRSYLMGDWPRIPIPARREALEASARLGRQVSDLLRPDIAFTPAPELRRLGQPARMDGAQLGDNDLRVTVRYSGVGRYEPPADGAGTTGGRLWWNDDCFWQDVPPEVWAFTIGGYPVVKKWLDYRHAEKLKRPLRLDEILYVREMIQRIATLLALGPRLDANYAAVKAETLPLDLARLGKPSLVAEVVE